MDDFTVRIKTYDVADPRLGRRVGHDSRSLAYLEPKTPSDVVLQSVRHKSEIPTLDQGQLGSCTGNAATKCLSYVPLWGPLAPAAAVLSIDDAQADEVYAVGVYSEATSVDPYEGSYPPDDTGSDGLSVAKVLTTRGLISGYRHATSMRRTLNALSRQPVIVGTEWREGMFAPEADGRLRTTGAVAGGHEYVLDEIDVENRRVWMQNSWGESWGVAGRAYFTWQDFRKLLKADGDCTVFVPVTEPAPLASS